MSDSEPLEPADAPRSSNPWVVVPLVMLMLLLPPVGFVATALIAGPLTENKTVVIPHGTNVREMATLLDKNGVIISPTVFRFASKVIGSDSLKAGEYEFTAHQSTADIILMLHEGRSVVHKFTVPEGLTSADISQMLKENLDLTSAASVPQEGSLLPETYLYSFGDSRATMVARMQKSMKETLNELWDQRDPSLPLKSKEEAVIMASVIEKETGKAEERPRIAGVFYNRLQKSMRLQSDPTVIYAIVQAKGSMDRELTRNDLTFSSPYNTYTSDGLPPKPICNPGRASLEAALHPEKNEYLYFVADGTGGHVFARDLNEHNQNVARWNNFKKTSLQ